MTTAEAADPRCTAGAGGGAGRLRARVVDFNARELADIVRAAVNAGGEIWLRASGASMWPTVLDDEQVLLAHPGTVLPGDIVLVQGEQRVVLHRVASVHAGRVVTWGDACLVPDAEVAMERVVARALACFRAGERPRPLAALECTRRFGLAALARWGWRRSRLALARRWRMVGR